MKLGDWNAHIPYLSMNFMAWAIFLALCQEQKVTHKEKPRVPQTKQVIYIASSFLPEIHKNDMAEGIITHNLRNKAEDSIIYSNESMTDTLNHYTWRCHSS